MCEHFTFCPICQLPLKAICISPDAHVSLCMTKCEEGEQEECPEGVHCLSTDIFHYRDFSHKLLAAYRSSSDFVPPDVDIKPSPMKKRKTPAKPAKRESSRVANKTPEKVKQKRNATTDSDSDSEILFEAKKPRRNLRFNNNNQSLSKVSGKVNSKPTPDKCSLKSKSGKQLSNSVLKKSPSNSFKPVLRSKVSVQDSPAKKVSQLSSCKPTKKASQITPIKTTKTVRSKTSQSVPTVLTSTTPNGGQNLDALAEKELYPVRNNAVRKLTIANVKLNENEELSLQATSFRSQSSLSSMSVTTSSTSKLSDSDLESIITEKPVTTTNTEIDSKFKTILKEQILLQEFLETSNMKDLNSSSNNLDKKSSCTKSVGSDNDKDNSLLESESNISLSKADFDDIIPVSTLDKEILKSLQTKNLGSPTTTVHSCSEYNDSATCASSSVTEECDDISDRSCSPEVVRPTRRQSALLSSSSDSDLPLASLVHKNSSISLNGAEVKAKLRSGNLSWNKNNVGVIGKEKAGKILRTLTKTPSYIIKDISLKSVMAKGETHGNSDKDSDSGKSTASKDASFVPSERSSSTNLSDSAFSAESTDRLTASSISSTYSSSETKSSDPWYYDDSDKSFKQNNKSRNSHKKNQILNKTSTPQKRLAKPLVYSDSSSSEISMKEKLLFKKSSKPTSKPLKINPVSRLIPDSTDTEESDKTGWQLLLNKMRNGCFPSDLKIDSEDSLTVASSCSGSDTSHASLMLPPRQCPFYKRIPGTPFAVDAFQYWNIPGVKVYFLSHFHSDHYIGLKKSFSHPIYCTKITANLVKMKLRVQEKWLRILELNEPHIINGVEVTALDANHCPGSVMLLFSLTNGRNYLHVGDFRATKSMTGIPALRRTTISTLFLDTTYCSSQYCFPTQEEVISKVIAIISAMVNQHPHTLVVCGSYLIGKEKVFVGVAEALNWRIWARPEKQRVLGCLGNPRINSRLVKDPRSANVHVLPMASIQITALQQHLASCSGAFTHVVGIKPSGWELNSKSGEFKVTSRDNISIYGVPYSEHSSFLELRDFVQFIQPQDIVPTVNVGSSHSRTKMNKYFTEWLQPTMQKTGTQLKVSQYFQPSCSS